MPELYTFQKEDIEKLAPARRAANGSEMGTGKTPFAVELEKVWYEELKGKPHYGTLIVAPLNTFTGWLDRYSEWEPEVDVTVIDRKNREAFLEAVRKKQGDAFLMHWDALRLMPELRQFPFQTIIADEAHRACNRKAQQTRALKKLKTYSKLAMSGTLTADSPAGLWSVLHWLYPQDHFLTSYWRFYKLLVDYEVVYPGGYHTVKGVNLKNIHLLHEFMEPFYVRHLKREQCCPHHPDGVMPWLPDKVYNQVYVELSPAQRRVYEQMRKDMIAWVGEHEDSPLAAQVVMVQMLRLSQMALAMPYMEGTSVKLTLPSSKLDAGIELFRDNQEKQFVAYTSSKQFLYVAAEELNRRGITTLAVSGDTPQHQRDTMVQDFNRGDFQIFLCMIQATEGIDGLQHTTDTAVFFDRTWSARMNNQAEDRLHRDGQKDTVEIIDIMARRTVDLGRHQRLEAKWKWIRQLLGDMNA